MLPECLAERLVQLDHVRHRSIEGPEVGQRVKTHRLLDLGGLGELFGAQCRRQQPLRGLDRGRDRASLR
ncbi:hypothetical protein ACQPWY_27165 [Pseudonocardia xinjiangensis]|uniref:hypothetical protein n=1 Tax=Pseudonocardia xinjiangensis TaxID=75289 RepID=UPI003D909B11